MTVLSIDHINIKAPKALLQEVCDFYVDVIGLERGFRPDFSSPGYWLYAGTLPVIHLSEESQDVPAYMGSYIDHLAFRCANADLLIEKLNATGRAYRVNRIPELQQIQVFLQDPVGFKLELNCIDYDGSDTIE